MHSPGTVGAIKIDWDAPVELTDEIRAAMAPHDLDTMRAGRVLKGFVVAGVTYPRGTLAFRVAEAHELFLELPFEPAVVARPVKVPGAWTAEVAGTMTHHRGTVGTEDDEERIDVVLASRVPELSRAKARRLLEDGKVRVGGQPVLKQNHRLRVGDVVELTIEMPEPN